MFAFAIIIVFLTFLGLEEKFSRWGKIHQVGYRSTRWVGTSETVKCVESTS